MLIPVYVRHWGAVNFLWFSDLALFGTLASLWLESGFIASMMAISVLLPEVGWNIDFFAQLLSGKKIAGLAAYMFEDTKPRYVRALSLFHVFLPPLMLWLIYRLGYFPGAWVAQTLVAWVVLPLAYVVGEPADNVNWVYGPTDKPQTRLPPRVYLLVVMLVFPLLIYLPTHFLLRAIFGI